MITGQLITRLRRRLNQPTGGPWDDNQLLDLLNDAWRELKQKITLIRPEEFVETWRTNIVANQGDYARLVSNERAVRILDTATDIYVPIEPLDWVQLKDFDDRSALAAGEYRYCHFGQAYRFRPIPATNITAGLEVEFLGLDSALPTVLSGNGPECPQTLHPLIIDRATILAMDESGESGSEAQGRALAEWDKVDDRVMFAYFDMQGEPMLLHGVR